MQDLGAIAFIKTALEIAQCPSMHDARGKLIPEIAVVGRSNVGKSSLLNYLFQRKNLVRTSAVPGKTQALNFFGVDKRLFFVDLPGYGYAKAPLEVRRTWGPMMAEYFNERINLRQVLLLVDIRRMPSEEDLQFLSLAAHHNCPVIIVLTKVDKVSASEKKSQTEAILQALAQPDLPFVHTSATKGFGRKELMSLIQKALA